MKKIAIVTTHPIQYNAPFFRALNQTGKIDIHVFYTWDKGGGEKFDPGFDKIVKWDVPLLEGYPYTFLKNISSKPGSHHFWGIINPHIIREIHGYKPDIILVYGWNFYSHLKVMWHFKNKVPVWFRGDSHLLDEPSGFKKLLRKLVLTQIYKYVDKALYVGENNRNYYSAFGIKETQLMLVPHVVDNDFFNTGKENYENLALEWRKSIGIADDKFVVEYAGKLEPKKNISLLIEAIHKLNEKETSFEKNLIYLIIVGNGPIEDKLKELIKKKPYVHLLPFQNQSRMPIVYKLGNLVCLPSRGPGETWGLMLNEALACGRFIIASDKVGAAIDLITEKTGYIFRSDDVDDLCSKIELARNRFLNQKFNTNCYQFVNENFDLKKNVEILLKTIIAE